MVFLLLAGLRMAMRSDMVLDLIRSEVEVRVSDMLQAELRMERLHGDLWSHFTVEGIRIYEQNTPQADGSTETAETPQDDNIPETGQRQPVVSLDTLYISYSIVDLVFRRPVRVDNIQLLGLQADLHQDEDGLWNLLALLQDPEQPDESDTEPFYFVLDDLTLTARRIDVNARRMLPDEPFSIRDLDLNTRVGRNEQGFFADLRQLDLSVHESRLDEAVRLSSEATWDGTRITLDKLLIAGAYSAAEMSGSYNTVTSAVDVEALLDPLAWREAEAYFEPYPFRENLTVNLQVGGSRQDLRVGLSVRATGLEHLQIASQWSVLQEPVLRSLSITSESMDAGVLTGSETLAAGFESLAFSMSGTVPVGDWDRVNAAGDLLVEGVRFEQHELDELSMDWTARQDTTRSNIRLTRGDEAIVLNLEAAQWWEEDFGWEVSYETDGINPGFWSGIDALEGVLVSNGTISGRGLEPGSDPWISEIIISRFRLAEYPESSAEIHGAITSDSLVVSSTAGIGDGSIDMKAGMLWSAEVPGYDARIAFEELDLSLFPGLDSVSSNINGMLTAEGAGMDPETMYLDASLLMDNTYINREHFDTIWVELALRDGMARVDDAYLESTPATATLSLEQNIFDFRDIRNRLDLDLELMNLQGFANLAGVDSLQAQGRLTGTIRTDEQGQLVLESGLNLTNVQYDTLRAEQVEGSAMAILTPESEYRADLEIRSPSLGSYMLQDISLYTDGNYSEEEIRGVLDFEFNTDNESGYRQQAEYMVIGDSIRIRTHELILDDPAGTYRLRQPFDLVIADQTVILDTLRLASDNGSELMVNIRKTPGSTWSGVINARNTDLGQLQHVFLEEPAFEAMFTGQVGFELDEEMIMLDGQADITAFRFQSLELDSMRLALDLADRRLVTDARIWHAGEERMRSEFDIPCDPHNLGDPEPELFEGPVSGYLRINELDVDLFEEVLEDLGFQGMRGHLSMITRFSGVAGRPEVTGELRLQDGALSGVAIDTLIAGWDYEHDRSDIVLTSRVHSLGQKAADIRSRLPLYIDIPNLVIQGPEPDDPLDVSVFTSDFNLAAFNDFLNPEQFRNLQGRLDADVEIRGTPSEPEMSGNVNLSDGRLGVVENNVTFRNIHLDAGLTPGNLELERFSVQSVGSLNGQGTIALDGLLPDDVALQIRAANFQIFNTRDFEIFAGLDVQVSGSIEEPMVTGDVRWERGTLYIDDFGEREVEEVILEEEEQEVDAGPDIFERLGMEVKFNVDRNAFVRNRRDPEINLALRGELDLVKEPYGELQLFGDMGIPSGHVTTFNKRFQLVSGNIMFSGDPADPELDIRTLYEPRQQYEDIRIYYLITGTVSDPEFEYESEPEMELQDIISYTLFGRPFHALAGWEQTVSGRSDGSIATNIAVDILLDRIETLASDRLGIDVIEIDNTRKGGGSGTSIKAGKFISDRLFVAFLQELGGTDAGRQVMIEYIIRRNLELILTASDDYRSGVDMLWRYDY